MHSYCWDIPCSGDSPELGLKIRSHLNYCRATADGVLRDSLQQVWFQQSRWCLRSSPYSDNKDKRLIHCCHKRVKLWKSNTFGPPPWFASGKSHVLVLSSLFLCPSLISLFCLASWLGPLPKNHWQSFWGDTCKEGRKKHGCFDSRDSLAKCRALVFCSFFKFVQVCRGRGLIWFAIVNN